MMRSSRSRSAGQGRAGQGSSVWGWLGLGRPKKITQHGERGPVQCSVVSAVQAAQVCASNEYRVCSVVGLASSGRGRGPEMDGPVVVRE